MGLGDRFLGHAERCGAILHLIDGTGDEVAKTYKTIRAELEAYGHGLGEKHEIVALNKIDAIPAGELAKKRAALEKASGGKVFLLSGVSGKGVPDVLRAMAREINQRRLERAERLEARRPAAARAPTTRAERQSARISTRRWCPRPVTRCRKKAFTSRQRALQRQILSSPNLSRAKPR